MQNIMKYGLYKENMSHTHNRRTNWSWLTALVAIACLFFGAATMQAQFETASVLGYVHDNSGAAVPNATVTLTNVATNVSQTAKTDGEGKYEFNSIQIGDYTILTTASGFQETRIAKFNVATNARQRVDVSVSPGTVNQVVEVTSAAQLLETETSSRGTVVQTRAVENLPLNGRSYADLVLLAPGVRKSQLENNGTSSREASFNINGQRSAFNNFLLDGLDNNNYGTSNQGFANENIPPSPDAVNEFRVETNNYSAEYGRASGAVINVSTRRGTNQYHGKAWDYIRNTNLNAVGPFPGAVGTPKPVLIRNQFGGTFGGRIIKDHTFFFVDYEGVRQISRSIQNATLPNAEQRAGIFNLYTNNGTGGVTSTPIPLKNPVTGTTYSGVVPSVAMTPFARAVLAALPATNSPYAVNDYANGFSSNYSSLPRGVIKDDKGDGRIDHTFNQKWSMFARYSHHLGYLFDAPNIPGRAGGNANGNTHILNKQIAGGVTWVISGSKLLDIRFAWTKNEGGKTPIGQGDSSLLTENGITIGIPTDPSLVRDLNVQNISSFSQFGAQPSSPQFQNPTIYNPKANFTWVKGKHSMKFGYEYQAVNTVVNDFNPSYGQDNYASGFSNNGSPANSSPVTSSYSTQLSQARNLADFMFGNRSSYSLTNYQVVNLRQRFNFMYFQDDMKLLPSLTVNAGLRYEIATPQWERDNKLANFDPATKTLIQAKNGGVYDRALVHVPTKNFAPRIGFSWTPRSKTVIRGGYGISFTQYNRAGGENNLTYNGPNVVNATINNPAPTGANSCITANDATQDQTTCFRQTQQGYAPTLTAPANFNPLKATSRYIPANFATGYVQSYHFGVQYQLPHAMVLDIAYVGNKGTHLQILADYNQATPCLGASVAACNSTVVGGVAQTYQNRRPVPTFNDIEIAWGGGVSNYNALQAKLEKRAGALYLLNSFTYSRTFDLASGHLETAYGDNSRVNFANPRNDYGPSGYDQPLSNTTSILYDLPYGRGRHFGSHANGLMNAVLGGWQLTIINTMTSGLPFNITYSNSATSTTAATGGSGASTVGALYTTDLVTVRPQHITGAPLKANASARVKTRTSLTGYLPRTSYDFPSYSLYGNTSPYGNVRRNMLRSYAYFNTDLGLHKAFDLWKESTKLDFRAEAFNALNHVNYTAPDGNISNGTFGAISGAFPARTLQLAAKFIF